MNNSRTPSRDLPTRGNRPLLKPLLGLGVLSLIAMAIMIPLRAHDSHDHAHDHDQKHAAKKPSGKRAWIAGDHHIHSRFSVGYDRNSNPPKIIIGGDAIYPIPTNAFMARKHGLSWMVATDHGGPNHAKVNLEQAYPELVQSRLAVPEVIQFYGMEFDTPGADHSSLIIPHTHDEADRLHELEHRFAKNETHPLDSSRDTEPKMLEALSHMRQMKKRPVLIANHPARSARGPGVYGLDYPAEFRGWNDTAPEVAVGMEGAPGHQAATINPDGTLKPTASRAGYGQYPTSGGFDQMSSRLGGFWDSMLGEGRHWWITSTSDSHRHWREGGADFWPGEYSKTYVHAARNHDDILAGIRGGRVFVTTGDLISELYVTVKQKSFFKRRQADIGGTLNSTKSRSDLEVTISYKSPEMPNHHGERPQVARVDLIVGKITGPVAKRDTDTNATTRVVKRFTAKDWSVKNGTASMTYVLKDVESDCYVRVRGTNTNELEPAMDPPGEDPWTDLWFYSNPVFVKLSK